MTMHVAGTHRQHWHVLQLEGAWGLRDDRLHCVCSGTWPSRGRVTRARTPGALGRRLGGI